MPIQMSSNVISQYFLYIQINFSHDHYWFPVTLPIYFTFITLELRDFFYMLILGEKNNVLFKPVVSVPGMQQAFSTGWSSYPNVTFSP